MKIVLTLRDKEFNALYVLAEQECRDTRDQATFIIRQALEQRGLLAPESLSQGSQMTGAGCNG